MGLQRHALKLRGVVPTEALFDRTYWSIGKGCWDLGNGKNSFVLRFSKLPTYNQFFLQCKSLNLHRDTPKLTQKKF
jgi:hypothetical protein